MDAVFLSAALAEAGQALSGARVVQVVAGGPEGLALETQGPGGRAWLHLGWEGWGPRWYVIPEPPRGEGESPFAAAVTRALRGGRITGLVRPGMDRAVAIQVACRRRRTSGQVALWAVLWPARRNVVLVDTDARTVIAAARPGPWRAGAPFAAPAGGGDCLLRPEDAEGFQARMCPLLAEGVGPEAALVRAFPSLGPLLAREIAFRAARRPRPVPPLPFVPALGASTEPAVGPPAGPLGEDLGALRSAFAEVAIAVCEGRFAPRVVLGPEGEPLALSGLALAHVPEDRQRAYPAAGAAAAAYFAARRAAAEAREERAWAARALRQTRERLARRIAKLEEELGEHRRAEAYRQMGQILVVHQRGVSRGAAEACLPDPYAPPGATRAIPLDPSISVAANAERFFKLARRGARGEGLVAQRLAASRRDLDGIADLEKELADAGSLGQVRGVSAGIRRLMRVPGRAPRLAARESTGRGPKSTVAGHGGPRPPRAGRAGREAKVARRFLSTDGLPILVGRDNAGNDELTLHLAAPDDLWLHVEGTGGSHVVVRREGRAEVPRQTLVEAAQLAAYYSQARGQRKVPVHYTLRKHVRKPKGAKPGLVSITREKTILATPDGDLVRRLAARAHEPAD